MRSTTGFTIIELLIASIILLLLLTFAGAFLNQGATAHRTVAERSEEQELLDSISQVLMYDFRLAGYRGPTTAPAPLSEAITHEGNATTIHYALEANSSRPYETAGAQQITYAVHDAELTRCHALASAPTACMGGLTTLADGIINFTVDTHSLNGHGVTIDILRTPYGCDATDCTTPYTVRVPFPQPLSTKEPQ